MKKLREEQVESRKLAQEERRLVLSDRRTEFEISQLGRLIVAIMTLGRRVAQVSFIFEAAPSFQSARLDDNLDEQLREAHVEMRVAAELVLDESIRESANRLQIDYIAATTSRSLVSMKEKLNIVDPVASGLLDAAAARIRQLYNDLESG